MAIKVDGYNRGVIVYSPGGKFCTFIPNLRPEEYLACPERYYKHHLSGPTTIVSNINLEEDSDSNGSWHDAIKILEGE